MNKRSKAFLFGVCVLSLSSCDLPIRPIHAIRQETIWYNVPGRYNMGATSYQQSSLPSGYTVSDLSTLKDGFILVKDSSNGHLGAYSPFTNALIVPAEYLSIDLLASEDNGVYLQAHKNGSFDVYDFLGYPVVSNIADTSSFGIKATQVTLACEETRLIEEYRIDDAITLHAIASDRSRTSFAYPSYLLSQWGSQFEPSTFDLSTLGLEGYAGSLTKEGMFNVSHAGEACSSVNVADAPDVRLCFWKAFFSQSNSVTTDDDYDYSLTIAGEETHFKVDTLQTALINGDTKDLSVHYLIEDIRPLYDEQRQAHYALVYAFPIRDRQLASDLAIYVINNDGEIVLDATQDPAYQYTTYFLTPYKFYDPMSGSLVDYDFNLVGTLSEDVVAHNSTWEYLKTADGSGLSHLYNFNGELLLPDAYSYLSIDVAPDTVAYGVNSQGVAARLHPLEGTSDPITLSANQKVSDCGLGVLRLDTLNGSAISASSYQTYASAPLATYSSAPLASGSITSSLFRGYSEAYLDSASGTYSFFTSRCVY